LTLSKGDSALRPHTGVMTNEAFGSWSERYWSGRSLTALIDHIIEEYQHPLHRDMNAIERLLQILQEREAAHRHLVGPLAELCERLEAVMRAHATDEEIVFFPHVVGLTEGHVATALNMGAILPKLTHDHVRLLDTLQQIRHSTDDFQPPADASVLLSALFALLQDVDRQLRQQLDLEQRILFPRAAALEKGRAIGGPTMTNRSVIVSPRSAFAPWVPALRTLD
jgi:iron-sulfur cluster repair protein YtfE (RIC family)